jgi:transposase
MARPRKYPEVLIQRGIGLAMESDRPITHIAVDLGMHPETLRKEVRQHEADGGKRPDVATSAEREEIRRLGLRPDLPTSEEIKALRKEVYELRRRNEILKAASVLSRPSSMQTERTEPPH